MVDDFYSEQEQWERVKLWLRENGLWLLAGVVIGVLGLVGWRWWEQRIETQALAASTKYSQVLDAFSRADRTRAFTLIDELQKEHGSSPYADQADLLAARALVDTNELAKAGERLTKVMTQSRDDELKLVARLRLARVQLAQGNPDVAIGTLEGAPAGAFAARFEDVRGDALYAKGDKPGALRAWRKAVETDTEGTVDRNGLDLKIADLVGDGVADPALAAASPGAASAATPAAPAAAAPAAMSVPTQPAAAPATGASR